MPKKVQQTEHPVLDMTMPERKATDMSGFFRDHKLPDQNVTGFSDGALFTGDSIEWMKTINDESIDMVFADPPYNIKKADWDDFGSQERYIEPERINFFQTPVASRHFAISWIKGHLMVTSFCLQG